MKVFVSLDDNDHNNHNATAGDNHATAGNKDQPQQPTTTTRLNDRNIHDTTMGNEDTTPGNDANATTNHNCKTQRLQQPRRNHRK